MLQSLQSVSQAGYEIIMSTIRTYVRKRTTVQPGGQVVVSDPALHTGASVEVLILLPEEQQEPRQSIMDVLNSVPGHLLFQKAEDVNQYLREERASWQYTPPPHSWAMPRLSYPMMVVIKE
jgi:hypothetical protein